MTNVRTRFAPSPTGYLHLGGTRTALFNWLYARHTGGSFILRVEDTDRERSKQEFTDTILDSMRWLGLDWDEGPYFQSERDTLYQPGIERLLSEEKAYRCYCSPEELERKRKEAQARGEKPKYDGTCRGKNLPMRDEPYVVRFLTPKSGATEFTDLVKGKIRFENSELDDLIIRRSDGSPTYNFTVVIDDADMNITHVIRGDDHINNTPRQIVIFKALGYDIPAYAHMPLTLGPDKARLSKRHGAKSITEYRNEGILPDALVNYIVRLGWSHGDQEIFSMEELIEKFDIADIGKSAGIFDQEKMEWLSAHYIKEAKNERLAAAIAPLLQERGFEVKDTEWLKKAVGTLKERSKTLREIVELGDFYFTDEIEYDEKAKQKFFTPEVVAPFRELVNAFGDLAVWNQEEIERAFTVVLDGLELKLSKVAQPLRVALTGKTVSPGIFEIIEVIGKERVMARIQRAISLIEEEKK
jgi:glutamyl-tRNA synthetase